MARIPFIVFLGLAVGRIPAVAAAEARGDAPSLAARVFSHPELTISSQHEPLDRLLSRLPNRAAWESQVRSAPVQAYVDPRSGAATSVLGAFPLLPGSGVGNRVTLESLGVARLTPEIVASTARRFLERNEGVLGIDLAQLGPLRAEPVTDELWQVSAPQQVDGVEVRDARLVVTIKHGNVVVFGTQVWGHVALSTKAQVAEAKAVEAAFAHVGGRSREDRLARPPRLELLPTAPPEFRVGEGYDGPVGAGYRHRLAWSVLFQRGLDPVEWEALVDAHDGTLLAFEKRSPSFGPPDEQVVGGVYPFTNTGTCPTPQTCGTMETGWPMPFADTGFPAPDDFTTTGGRFAWPGGTTATTLTGRYVRITDACGPIAASSSTGSIDLGGTNGDHDCTTPGSGGAGNTAAARTAFYELDKLTEQARGWLTLSSWLQAPIAAAVNVNGSCGAGYIVGTGSLYFYRSGGCRNPGEIASVFDHEWGHALDDNDAGGVMSNSSEAYGDIVAMYRLQSSCVGYGYADGPAGPCGLTADGTGRNVDEDQTAALHCALNCSGVREADWDQHADHTPDTALGFVCTSCLTGTGPCGRQTHCASAPIRQAAWDLAARDLRAPPFNYSLQQAFVVANRIFYQGSGNVGLWHACTCGASSSGCGATNGYLQWLAADDDNGNLADGTPHMGALFAAFDRHGVACATPAPTNSGCAGGPVAHPPLSAVAGSGSVTLAWDPVPGAVRYWVFRTEGHAGCLYGKARIAEVTGNGYIDTGLLPGRTYAYNVAAVGASSACMGRLSRCATETPRP